MKLSKLTLNVERHAGVGVAPREQGEVAPQLFARDEYFCSFVGWLTDRPRQNGHLPR
jgi:hypothetical protein